MAKDTTSQKNSTHPPTVATSTTNLSRPQRSTAITKTPAASMFTKRKMVFQDDSESSLSGLQAQHSVQAFEEFSQVTPTHDGECTFDPTTDLNLNFEEHGPTPGMGTLPPM